ncbi:metallophosphoesterase [Rufibacter soli]
MLYQIVLFLLLALAIWLLYSYLKERKYRKKPFYALADIGWRTNTPPPIEERIHSVALVGDIGKAGPVGEDGVMNTISFWMQEAGKDSTIIFLGDNIYPTGVPPEGSFKRAAALQKLQHQLDLLKTFPGKVIYLSGNHDWNKGRKDGYDYVLRQEKIITEQLKDPTAYLPPAGSLGPVTVEVNERLVIVVINTQWWVQAGYKPLDAANGTVYAQPKEFFQALEAVLEANKDKFILLAGHHPMYSNALHGGRFTVKQQLFPLTFVHKKAYVPLPIMGSLFRMYRKYIGVHEDMAFPPFKKFRKRLLKVLHRHHPIFYVAGHDHNLQYFKVQGNHYAVSGSGSKTNFVAKGGKASFSHESKGFMVLDHYRDGSVWLRVLEPAVTVNEPPFLMFQKCIYTPEPVVTPPLQAATPEGF